MVGSSIEVSRSLCQKDPVVTFGEVHSFNYQAKVGENIRKAHNPASVLERVINGENFEYAVDGVLGCPHLFEVRMHYLYRCVAHFFRFDMVLIKAPPIYLETTT
jgi:hypothetical protein